MAGFGAVAHPRTQITLHQIKAGIGYVESAYPDHNRLTTVLLLNQAGTFVAPKTAAFEAAAAKADWSSVENFAVDLNNQLGAQSWPIASATLVLLPANPKYVNRSAVVKNFSTSASRGSDIAAQLLYVPLPDNVHSAIRTAWQKEVPETTQGSGGPSPL
jgi:phosphate transport system substrate-binding protein